MTRPRDELREALRKAADALAPAGCETGVTWRALVRRACVGELMGRRTVDNMLRCGELELAGFGAAPGVNRPMRLLRVAQPVAPPRVPPCGPAARRLQEAWAPAS